MSDFAGQADDNEPLNVAADIESSLRGNQPQEQTAPTPEPEEAVVEQNLRSNAEPAPQTPEREVGDNPVWQPFKDTLGEQLYYSVKPHLAKIDQEYTRGITAANAKYEPYKQFEENGLAPEYLLQAAGVAQRIQTDPVGFFNDMKTYLEENGHLPKTQAQVDEALGNDPDPEQGLENVDDDSELARLRQQVQALEGFAQTQQQREQQFEAQQFINTESTKIETGLRQEIEGLRAANPHLDNDTMRLVVERAQYLHMTTGKMPTMAEAAAPFIASTERVLNTPRANDTAPRLPGSGGGIPSTQKPLNEYTKADDIAGLTAILEARKSG